MGDCCKKEKGSLYKGDDSNAFYQPWVTINLKNIPEGWVISKAEFRCGQILKEYENPTFPIIVDLSKEETVKLQCENTCYLAVYDDQGRKQTCTGSLKFPSNKQVV